MVFRSMNEDWRASKSTLVGKVRKASNEEERLNLQPDNVKSVHDWKAFVKEKTSAKFKVYASYIFITCSSPSSPAFQNSCEINVSRYMHHIYSFMLAAFGDILH